MCLCSFHPKDVLDLEWSPDGTALISGSVDNNCIIWSVAKGRHSSPSRTFNNSSIYEQNACRSCHVTHPQLMPPCGAHEQVPQCRS